MACGNCFNLANFDPNCLKNQPGGTVMEFSIVPFCYIESVTRDVLGNVTAVTLDTVTYPTATWFKVAARKDSVIYNETLNASNNSYQETIVFTIANYSSNTDLAEAAQEQSNFIKQLVASTGGWAIITKDKLGIRFFHGIDTPLYVSVLDKSRGTLGTDLAGTTITITEAQGEPAPAILTAATFTPSTNVI